MERDRAIEILRQNRVETFDDNRTVEQVAQEILDSGSPALKPPLEKFVLEQTVQTAIVEL